MADKCHPFFRAPRVSLLGCTTVCDPLKVPAAGEIVGATEAIAAIVLLEVLPFSAGLELVVCFSSLQTTCPLP
jgi:hypothetical protein